MRINKLLVVLGCVLLTGCGSNSPSKESTSGSHYITATPVVTNTPTMEIAVSETPTPTKAPATPTEEPTATPTVEPTTEPTKAPTSTPTEAIINPGSTEKYNLNMDWEFASYSKINTGSSTLYRTNDASPKHITVCVNAGHGTSHGTEYSVQCHPDGSAKIVSGSTSAGKTTAVAIAYGTVLKDGTAEAIATKRLALVLKDVLLNNGYDVLMIRENDDVALDNIARTVMANNLADCHIAIHYDSTDNDKGAFYMSVPDVASYKSMYPVSKVWAESDRLGEAIISGFKDNGIKIFSRGSMEMDLVQMSYSTIPNIDLEVGDTASDCSLVALSQLSQGILSGLNTFYSK